MKKPCPDLVGLSDSELRQFWETHKPQDFKALGDRLLAECLPRFAAREESFYPADLAERRRAIPMNPQQMAELLGVNLSLVRCWEERTLRPPASLSLIYKALSPK